VREATGDLVKLLASLNGPDGSIAVPGIAELVRPVTPEEKAIYEKITFDPEAYRKEVGRPDGIALRRGRLQAEADLECSVLARADGRCQQCRP
jgi:hypothetical protein